MVVVKNLDNKTGLGILTYIWCLCTESIISAVSRPKLIEINIDKTKEYTNSNKSCKNRANIVIIIKSNPIEKTNK